MAYSDVKTMFMAVLNRRDITASLTTLFITNAIQRAQRNLRLPSMEKVVVMTMDGSTPLLVPGDMLSLIDLTLTGTTYNKLVGTNYEQAAAYASTSGDPLYYYRSGGQYILGPSPLAGAVITIRYYADAGTLSADTDTNWMTEIAPDLLVYGALSYACDYFLDNRRNGFEERFVGIMNDLQMMAMDDILSGGAAIAPNQSFIDPTTIYS